MDKNYVITSFLYCGLSISRLNQNQQLTTIIEQDNCSHYMLKFTVRSRVKKSPLALTGATEKYKKSDYICTQSETVALCAVTSKTNYLVKSLLLFKVK